MEGIVGSFPLIFDIAGTMSSVSLTLPLSQFLLSPTDFSQQLGRERCEKFLRLRMIERDRGAGFFSELGVHPNESPSVLARDGDAFEQRVVAALRTSRVIFPSLDAAKTELKPGQSGLVFQPRLEATLGRWSIRGDADLIELRRDDSGALSARIIDIKNTDAPKVEHKLQVAFYAALLEAAHQIPAPDLAILHQAPNPNHPQRVPGEPNKETALFGSPLLGLGVLTLVADPAAYRAEVDALVHGENALADRIADVPFESLFFALSRKCDSCRYGELCQKQVRESGDLSLVPYLSPRDKRALLTAGVGDVHALATLKNFDGEALALAPEKGETLQKLAASSVGPRLDELILRARRAAGLPTLAAIPGLGHPTLPHADTEMHPNLVQVFIELHGDQSIYLAAARVEAFESGTLARTESVVELQTDAESRDEAELLACWMARALEALIRLAAGPQVPLHLIFWDAASESQATEALARNLGALPLDALLSQPAAFDSPNVSFLSTEIRERRNWPLLSQSLIEIASYLKFDWGNLREKFSRGIFDGGPNRPRHDSRLPVEYVYGAWGKLPAGDLRFANFAKITRAELVAFAEKRLEAMAFIAEKLPKNQRAYKTPFDLSGLLAPPPDAPTLADALAEFLALERHTFLAAWRDARQLPPERRMLHGETLLVSYDESDQTPEVAVHLRECARRKPLQDAWRTENPGKQLRGPLKEELGWSLEGQRVRLRLELSRADITLPALLGLLDLKEGDSVVLSPRWSSDERLPEAERVPFTPTPKQLLYATRARIEALPTPENPTVTLVLDRGFGSLKGFTFGPISKILVPGEIYTLDPSPDDIFGYWHYKVIESLKLLEKNDETERHALYHYLKSLPAPIMGSQTRNSGPPLSGLGKFEAGLDALFRAGHFHDFEASKKTYIGGHFDEKVLLVQGPPGTGKSYSTAFAVLARVQNALEQNKPCRVFLSCKTHSATDVLLRGVWEALETLKKLRQKDKNLWVQYFNLELLEINLIRLEKGGFEGVEILSSSDKNTLNRIQNEKISIVAGTPGGIYKLVKDAGLIGTNLCEWLILDEASQMSLPEALMAALPLTPEGKVIVVGDPRQMPPIVQHDWSTESRPTFQTNPVYRSLYETLAERNVPTIAFEESFRLHKTLARFLRDEIYHKDGINYHSHKTKTLEPKLVFDPLVAAALTPDCPLIVITHDEAASQTRNLIEEALIGPILAALIDEHGLDGKTGFGVVVPHRAQRAGLRIAYPFLGAGVDTVERYQGDEREAILISAVESDPEFLSASAAFLLDPRRLNVALSRAKKKLILIASQSIFELLPTDDALFGHAQFWKNLLRRACTEKLHSEVRDGHKITVWGGKSS